MPTRPPHSLLYGTHSGLSGRPAKLTVEPTPELLIIEETEPVQPVQPVQPLRPLAATAVSADRLHALRRDIHRYAGDATYMITRRRQRHWQAMIEQLGWECHDGYEKPHEILWHQDQQSYLIELQYINYFGPIVLCHLEQAELAEFCRLSILSGQDRRSMGGQRQYEPKVSLLADQGQELLFERRETGPYRRRIPFQLTINHVNGPSLHPNSTFEIDMTRRGLSWLSRWVDLLPA